MNDRLAETVMPPDPFAELLAVPTARLCGARARTQPVGVNAKGITASARMAAHLVALADGATDEQIVPHAPFVEHLLAFAAGLDVPSYDRVLWAVLKRQIQLVDPARITAQHTTAYLPNYRSKNVVEQIRAEKLRLAAVCNVLAFRHKNLTQQMPADGAAPPELVAAYVQSAQALHAAQSSISALASSLAVHCCDLLQEVAAADDPRTPAIVAECHIIRQSSFMIRVPGVQPARRRQAVGEQPARRPASGRE